MVDDHLMNLSPLDGRYRKKVSSLQNYFSEDALIRYRILIECRYLIVLSDFRVIRKLNQKEISLLSTLWQRKDGSTIVKDFEQQTHHDVKAVEYYIASILKKNSSDLLSFIHFGLTSEDTNNLAYRLMMRDAFQRVLQPSLHQLLTRLVKLADLHKSLPMLARTHGQRAIPTTLGKELAVYIARLVEQLEILDSVSIRGKCNGAVGTYAAMTFALPAIDWMKLSRSFVESLDLEHRPLTTQSNYPDDFLRLFSSLQLINSIIIDLNQDMWRYISDDWLSQKGKSRFVGSSTMPQKINPIEFENSEGNLGMANALFEFFNRKLPISRLQRDLSDSTVMRNIGCAFGYCLLGYASLQEGLSKIEPNINQISADLTQDYAILSEAWQTQARTTGNSKAYEEVARATRGIKIDDMTWKALTKTDSRLCALTPENYLGAAVKLTKDTIRTANYYLKNHSVVD